VTAVTIGLETFPIRSHELQGSVVLPIANAADVVVRVEWRIENDGQLVCNLLALDATSGDPPADPRDGFLPPNVSPPEGEGAIFFSVAPRRGAVEGVAIANMASIVFDSNDVIITNAVSNTVDEQAPSSAVMAMEPVQSDTTIVVRWAGWILGLGAQFRCLREH